jgi:hypothetical protein
MICTDGLMEGRDMVYAFELALLVSESGEAKTLPKWPKKKTETCCDEHSTGRMHSVFRSVSFHSSISNIIT